MRHTSSAAALDRFGAEAVEFLYPRATLGQFLGALQEHRLDKTGLKVWHPSTNHLAGSRTMLNHDHERRHYGIQKVEAAGRGSPSAGEASDGGPVPRIARRSGADCEGVPGRLRRATEATFADHIVPL